MSIDQWAERAARACERHGLIDCRHWFGRAEGGRIVAFVATKGGVSAQRRT
jgi:hypothetical protein